MTVFPRRWGVFSGSRVGPCLLLLLAPVASAAPPVVHDAETSRPWNQVFAAFFTRQGPDGKVAGGDRLEPLLWPNTQRFRDPAVARQTHDLLAALARDLAESPRREPLRRALWQRDLWLVAQWAAESHADDPHPLLRDLLAQLAGLIRQLALTREEISALPDNYAQAVRSAAFPARFDAEAPGKAFLPPDMLTAGGDWVCVGRLDGPTAPAHLEASAGVAISHGHNPFTNSVFFVLLRLPAGRAAAEAWVTQVARHKAPLFLPPEVDRETGKTGYSKPNLAFPQLPPGTVLALVRRALLIDTAGRLTPSPLTESVQIRVLTAHEPPDQFGGVAFSSAQVREFAAYKFELRRSLLWAGQAGGLCETTDLRDFPTGFLADRFGDPFELDRTPTAEQPYPPKFEHATRVARLGCVSCHGSATVYGTQSFQRPWYYDEELHERSPPLFPIAVQPLAEVERRAVVWKERQPGWTALQKLMKHIPAQAP